MTPRIDQNRRWTPRPPASALRHAQSIIADVCRIAGSATHRIDAAQVFHARGLSDAIKKHDTPAIFNWLVELTHYQGISDQVASTFIAQNGTVTWQEIKEGLATIDASCPLLSTYWTFDRCGFDKTSITCREPDHIDACPLPRHTLRNGRLNQSAYSLFLFVRDVAGGNLAQWIDDQIGSVEDRASADAAIQRLIEPLRHVYGVSDKILSMSLSALLIGAAATKPLWYAVGVRMIVVDTLVHNFLHRTGILGRLGVDHAYGARCYQPGGCADVIRSASARIDARQASRNYPPDFPRYVQHAIWSFCAQSGMNICNGNQVDDTQPCQYRLCQFNGECDHITLISSKNGAISTV